MSSVWRIMFKGQLEMTSDGVSAQISIANMKRLRIYSPNTILLFTPIKTGRDYEITVLITYDTTQVVYMHWSVNGD